eukprot:5542442-Alexandrium_andersonii.AAC.1
MRQAAEPPQAAHGSSMVHAGLEVGRPVPSSASLPTWGPRRRRLAAAQMALEALTQSPVSVP